MIGETLSAYRIESELGSGGMGKVYLAELSKKSGGLDQGRRVALKVIHASLLEQEGFFQRFLREAQVGQRVEHANVVRTYACDATLHKGVQHNFLVMEYVEGQTLRDLLQELERVPEELCRHIAREVTKGLGAIHAAGVVHRDIKPENVLITEEQVVKVMDLGVARLQDEAIRLSQTGAFLGSVEYAAPEQFIGVSEELDGRTDLHALGLILYELATGQNPYRDEDARKVLRKVLDETPRRVGEVNPQLSPFFEEVVHTLLAKKREERFDSAVALLEVLEDGEEGEWWKERAKALRIETKQPLRRMRVPRETALYGRDAELETLASLFAKAKDGEGHVLLIEGEAGIGKTRIVDELVGRLRQDGEDINFLFGSYPPGGAATAAGAFSTAYREQFGKEGLEETLAGYLGETPLLVPAFAALLKGDATPTGAEPLTKDSLQTVFVHATRALGAERTTIVLIDDLHFAPEDGRSLFASLAAALHGHRVLLVGTSRPGTAEDWVANLERLGHTSRMSLARLGPKDLTRLLMDAFQSERLAQELGFQIALKSDGNPFFAFEIIRGLREGEFITQSVDGTWVSTQVIQDIKIPSSVVDLIQARLQDLSDEERELLDVAACYGFEFDPSLVAEVVGMKRIPALRAFGRVESRHRLVRSAGQNLVFDHYQVQESLYGALLGQLRSEYHTAIADAFEEREDAGDKDPAELDGGLCVNLCGHYLKGGRGKKALRYLDAALEHLEQNYLNDQVLKLVDRALDMKGLLKGARRVEILLRKNERLGLMGHPKEQDPVLAEARALAEAAGEASLAKVESATGWLFQSTSRYEEAKAPLGHALAIYREIEDRKGKANTHATLGLVFYRQGAMEDAREQFERAMFHWKEIDDRKGQADMANHLGNLFHSQGASSEARAQYERSLKLQRELGNRSGEAAATGNLGNELDADGAFEQALARHEGQRALAREIGVRILESISFHNGGCVLAQLGRLDLAVESLNASLRIAREIGYRLLEADSLANLGDVLGHQGDAESSDAMQREAIALFEKMQVRNAYAAWAHVAYGAFLSDVGRAEDAIATLEDGAQIAEEAGAHGDRVLALAHLAKLGAVEAGVAVEALREVEERMGHTRKTEARFLLFQVTGDRAHLNEAKRLLDHALAQASEENREAMVTNVRVNRDIMQAWKEQAS